MHGAFKFNFWTYQELDIRKKYPLKILKIETQLNTPNA